MKMYHGTVDLFLPSIQKEGLKPSPKHAWRVAWDNGSEIRDVEPVDSVYLTKSKRHAIQYAETRVRYFAAKPGAEFSMFDAPHFILTKDRDTEILQVTPVLLIIEVNAGDLRLGDDPHDPGNAMKFFGVIPPVQIIEVVSLSTTLKEHVDSRYDRGEDYNYDESFDDLAQLVLGY